MTRVGTTLSLLLAFFGGLCVTKTTGALIGVNQNLDRSSALNYCQSVYQGGLAKIDSQNDATDVREAAMNSGAAGSVWFALKPIFVWDDGETFNGTLSEYEDANATNLDGDLCMSFDESGVFSFEFCSQELPFVCDGVTASPTGAPSVEPSTAPTDAPSESNPYIGVNLRLNYLDASAYCQTNFGSYLATIRNEEENTLARKAASDAGIGRVYIGLTDRNNEGTFIWDDGDASTFRKWRENEPNNLRNEDCTLISTAGNWNDNRCSETLGFLCNPFVSAPSVSPSVAPSTAPSAVPSAVPTVAPSTTPSVAPSFAPTLSPTVSPTVSPTITPGAYIGVKTYGKVSYTEASDYCQFTFGTYLATIRSEEDNIAVRDAASQAGIANWAQIWIGLNVDQGEWSWDDGQSVIFTRWQTGSPPPVDNSENADCGVMLNQNNGYFWKNRDCDRVFWFVCNQP